MDAKDFFALVNALLIAVETSFALPKPMPAIPFPFPATTSTLKENLLPPFTTLATLLMLTTVSIASSSSCIRFGESARFFVLLISAILYLRKLFHFFVQPRRKPLPDRDRDSPPCQIL